MMKFAKLNEHPKIVLLCFRVVGRVGGPSKKKEIESVGGRLFFSSCQSKLISLRGMMM